MCRISGRPGHVSHLRANLCGIPSSDLDPHALLHFFEAHLRQRTFRLCVLDSADIFIVPEPILTGALKSQFDVAMTATGGSNAAPTPRLTCPNSLAQHVSELRPRSANEMGSTQWLALIWLWRRIYLCSFALGEMDTV